MAKRISDTQFAMTADESALSAAIESLIAVRANRFPKAASKPRKTRSDKGKNRQEELPGTAGA